MGQKVSHTPEIADALLERIVDPAEYESLRDVDFGYENLVLEGGGNKGIGYVGMLKALEDLGILQKCKRFAGASMGAVVAAKLALGGNSSEIFEDFLSNLSRLSSDGHCIDFLRSIVKKYGYHPGKKLLKHFRETCQRYTGNPDITFRELYDLRGVELCMTVTNLSSCSVEYFHPKTTPDVSIPLAIRMSLSIPVLFQPIKTSREEEDLSYMVDGGLMNNYPINAFDGWFLSMDPRHSFFHMIDTDKPQFGIYNDKTLGGVVYDAFESELNEEEYFSREGYKQPDRPKTQLVKKKAKEVEHLLQVKVEKGKLIKACKTFLQILSASDLDRSGSISLDEFMDAMKKCPTDVMETLFQQDQLTEEVFRTIDADGDGEITYSEFINFVQLKGVSLRHHMAAGSQRKITSLKGFLLAIMEARDLMIRRLLEKENDSERTIGIYTDYIGVTDFQLETEDKVFGVRQGWYSTLAFLKERRRKLKGK